MKDVLTNRMPAILVYLVLFPWYCFVAHGFLWTTTGNTHHHCRGPKLPEVSSFRRASKCWDSLVRQPVFQSKSDTQEECIEKSTVEKRSLLPYNEDNFWGATKSASEIMDFVTEQVFDGVPRRVDVISEEPPLVVVHDFISALQCREIMGAANETGRLGRSTMGATQKTSDTRTSSTVWLQGAECEGPLQTLATRVSRLSGHLPPHYMENCQVVRYEPGQSFDMHTDHLDSFNDLECRGRLATCLVYLNSQDDSSFQGGETHFFQFNHSVVPQQGSAVFFWNTEERPGSPNYAPTMNLTADWKLRHAGLPVESPRELVNKEKEAFKWVCNRWIHPIPFGANVRGLQDA